MEQSKAIEYGSRKASSDVLKPRYTYVVPDGVNTLFILGTKRLKRELAYSLDPVTRTNWFSEEKKKKYIYIYTHTHTHTLHERQELPDRIALFQLEYELHVSSIRLISQRRPFVGPSCRRMCVSSIS
jgi:hypothetical protein